MDDAPDPEEVLARILGPLSVDVAPAQHSSSTGITEEDLELEFDFGGLSLRELAESDDADQLETVDTYRPQTVEDCRSSSPACCKALRFPSCTYDSFALVERDKAKFEELHRSIRACDDILNSVETNLTSFRNDLAAVSADIESLQARSTALNVRLENRKAVEKALGPIVEELSVSPMVVSKIAEGHIDEAWIKTLAEVDKRAMAHKKNSQQQTQNKALADTGPLLEKLVLKVLAAFYPYSAPPTDHGDRRPLKEFETFSWPRSKPCDPPTSTPKSSNNKISSSSRTCLASSTVISRS